MVSFCKVFIRATSSFICRTSFKFFTLPADKSNLNSASLASFSSSITANSCLFFWRNSEVFILCDFNMLRALPQISSLDWLSDLSQISFFPTEQDLRCSNGYIENLATEEKRKMGRIWKQDGEVICGKDLRILF